MMLGGNASLYLMISATVSSVPSIVPRCWDRGNPGSERSFFVVWREGWPPLLLEGSIAG